MGPLFKDTSGFMVFPAVALLVLGSPHRTSSESHSLSLMATFIYGETPFPELTLAVTVNNVPVEYYDNNIKKVVSRRHWRANNSVEDTNGLYFVVENVHRSMKSQTHSLRKRFNHTNGICISQKFAACTLEGDSLSQFFLRDAYEGEETRTYDILEQRYNPRVPELIWTKLKMEAKKLTYINVYQPLCLKLLRQYLQQDKNVLMRRERPRIRVIQKSDPGTGGAQVCCLATGFFPRHINMTLLRDGQPLPEQDLTGGEVLPNGDGTFQMRKSLSVSEQQLKEKHLYICTVTHLDRRENFGLEPEDHPDIILITVLVVTVLAVIVLVVAIILYRRRHNGAPDPCQTSATVRYTAAHKTEQSDSTSISSSS
ncbi:major histocompatibility complex class I-related gene protein-like isoform X2 [Brienomyrus brachyistius]|uniref:major histocompatibility complex class I-related gene protein-like isoform X2 n=1 Tax=Brienomyrus brachyistius TaxID=42636 RepID=UPI0020B204FC|nr:major histocompatibility complex class I-related gene protein-like isoform X2 [Brienomyrus brachyistius]